MKRHLELQGLELARRLRKQGVWLDIPEDDSEHSRTLTNGLYITQNGTCHIRSINEIQSAYIFDLHVASKCSWPFQISKVEVEFPWGNVPIDWLPEPDKTDVRGVGYKFPSKDPLEFERKVVINNYVGCHRKLRRGDFVAGLLLGIGEQVPDGAGPSPTTAFLRVYDQFDEKYEVSLLVFIDRPDKGTRKNLKKEMRKPLLE